MSILEKDIIADVRLAFQRLRVTLFRNQVGAYQTEHGSWVHYGLFVGSSDFIGFREYVVKPEDVGRKLAVFTSIETKRPKGGRKQQEQIDWIERIKTAGGIAGFARGPLDAEMIIKEWESQQHGDESKAVQTVSRDKAT